jgi:tetratricopeptide (TPR) repeat protein
LVTSCSRYVGNKLDEGDRLFGERKYASAVGVYEEGLRFEPDNPHGIRQLGLAHQRLGNRRLAYVYLEKAKELAPQDAEVRLVLGNLYVQDHKFDLALAEAEAVLAFEPRSLDALYLLGSVHLERHQAAKALEAFQRIVDYSAGDARGSYLLGTALLKQNRVSEAIRQFENAAALAPDFYEPVAQIVERELSAGRFDAALARVQAALAKAPRSARFYHMLGAVQLARGEKAAAERAFVKATELQPGLAEAHASLSDLRRNQGKSDDALAKATQAVNAQPNNVSALMALALSYEQKANWGGARQTYERILAVKRDYAPAANNLAWLLSERLGDRQRAFELAQAAANASPQDPHVADTFGWILYRIGDRKKALTILNESAAKLPDDPVIQYHLGMVSRSTGDTVAARRAFAKAVSHPDSFPEKAQARKLLAALK